SDLGDAAGEVIARVGHLHGPPDVLEDALGPGLEHGDAGFLHEWWSLRMTAGRICRICRRPVGGSAYDTNSTSFASSPLSEGWWVSLPRPPFGRGAQAPGAYDFGPSPKGRPRETDPLPSEEAPHRLADRRHLLVGQLGEHRQAEHLGRGGGGHRQVVAADAPGGRRSREG